jgi:hypothetical protein
MDTTISRSLNPDGFNMGASSSTPILTTKFSLDTKAVTSFSIQLFMNELSSDVDGVFQLVASNDDGNTWVPIPDNGNFTFKAHVTGATQTSYFIFGSDASGLPAAGLINLIYTRTAGTGRLRKVIFGVINN